MPAIAAHLRTRVEFQSAPGREAGRCRIRLQAQGFIARFQSAPGREAGRCAHVVDSLAIIGRFNPRPAVRPGDAAVA